jgi:polysaccharide export outer membrane protein
MKMIASSLVLLSFALHCSAAFGQAGNDAAAKSKNAGSVPVPAQASQGTGGKAHDSVYVIGNDDKLAISVWKEPDLTRSLPVRSDGKISLPLVGEIVAAGRTPLQLEMDISNRLRNFITVPEVTVIVEQINSKKYNIVGYVNRPGAFPLTLDTTVMDAIALSGGFRDFAKTKGVYILRQNADGTQSRLNFNYKDFIKGKNLSQNVKIEPNDTIIVP